jgi:hypothetical protein
LGDLKDDGYNYDGWQGSVCEVNGTDPGTASGFGSN